MVVHMREHRVRDGLELVYRVPGAIRDDLEVVYTVPVANRDSREVVYSICNHGVLREMDGSIYFWEVGAGLADGDPDHDP